jgi:methionyl-tRNA formyltransferase
MKGDIVLLGSTDVSLAVAVAIHEAGMRLRAIVKTEKVFSISYSATGVTNVRSADIDEWAGSQDVPVIGFTNYHDLAAHFAADTPALCLVAGWYHIVPRHFRSMFKRGCYGLHASLLPQLRGGAPLNWAILSGATETGVSLFGMEDGVDDGLIYGQEVFTIGPRTTIAELVHESKDACAALVRKYLPDILAGRCEGRKQAGAESYGLQRTPEDGRVDWRKPAGEIDRLVRAVGRPYPGAFTMMEGEKVTIWAADPVTAAPQVFGACGQIARLAGVEDPVVVTGKGLLRILEATSDNGLNIIEKLRRSAHRRFSD